MLKKPRELIRSSQDHCRLIGGTGTQTTTGLGSANLQNTATSNPCMSNHCCLTKNVPAVLKMRPKKVFDAGLSFSLNPCGASIACASVVSRMPLVFWRESTLFPFQEVMPLLLNRRGWLLFRFGSLINVPNNEFLPVAFRLTCPSIPRCTPYWRRETVWRTRS